MAIDTKTKRLSLLNYNLPWVNTLPEPDGSFDTGDRLHFMNLYADDVLAPPPIFAYSIGDQMVVPAGDRDRSVYLGGPTAQLARPTGEADRETYVPGVAAMNVVPTGDRAKGVPGG